MEIVRDEGPLWNRNFIIILIVNCFISISFFIIKPNVSGLCKKPD